MDNKIFRAENTILCINLTKKTYRQLRTLLSNNIRKLHIFVFSMRRLDVDSLRHIAKICSRNSVICVVHLYSHDEKQTLRLMTKDIPKSKRTFFYKDDSGRKFRKKFSKEKEITIEHGRVTFSITIDGGTLERQVIDYF